MRALILALASTAFALSAGQAAAATYKAEEIIAFEVNGMQVGSTLADIEAKVASAAMVKDGEAYSGHQCWKDAASTKNVCVRSFLDLDGATKVEEIKYTVDIDDGVSPQAIIKRLAERYGEPTGNGSNFIYWSTAKKFYEFGSEPTLTAGPGVGQSLELTLTYRGLSDAASKAEFDASMKKSNEERKVRELAASEAAAKVDF